MRMEEILNYYDDLNRLAASKCESHYEAEELVADTMLAAVSFVSRGGTIEHLKTWLAGTLMHKYHDSLRRKYRMPRIINLDECAELAGEEEEPDCSAEYAEIRREVSYLARITREVLIQYYFGRSSVAEIASRLQVPEGTVKSRLAAGRAQVRKGLDAMDVRENCLPGKLYLGCAGEEGPNFEPRSLVENDLIAQNLLILAYGSPLYMQELSKKIGIPAAYIEPIVDRLVDGELMVRTDKDKYYTDFVIYEPEDLLQRFDGQLRFVDRHFDRLWSCMEELIARIDGLDVSGGLNHRQLTKLERYACMKALQDFFQNRSIGGGSRYPKRKDGGRWVAMGTKIPAGYDESSKSAADEYTVFGGHRTTMEDCDYHGAAFLELLEFDTSLWDSPHRFTACGCGDYFKYITRLLWCVYKSVPMEESGLPNSMLESIPQLEAVGLLSSGTGKLAVDIPVLTKREYRQVAAAVNAAYDRLSEELGEEYRIFLRGSALQVPSQIKNVLDTHRFLPATGYLVMATVREAYEKGLHLRDVDYCCPPVAMVYESV